MVVEIRAARPEEMEEFRYVISTALVMSRDTFGTEEELAHSAGWTTCAFEDGNLATAYRSWPWKIRFNGEAIPLAAINSVGTLPVYRRRGYLRKVTRAHFERLHERGEQPVAALWASRAAIYQRYGYAVVTTNITYNLDPQYLEFTHPKPVTGSFREIGDDEFSLLVNLYRQFRADKTAYIHRSRDHWNHELLNPPSPGGFLCKVAYVEDGEPLGYCLYTVDPSSELGSGQRLIIRDLIWLKFSAYQAIWEYFSNMDLVSNITWTRVPVDDPLPHLMLEPRRINITARDGLLGRIVDVEQALPKRHYDEEGTLTFEVIDDFCPWNEGRWKLETSTNESSINRATEDPQLVIPVSTLALLFFGQLGASEAARMEYLEVLDDGALPLWDRVMKTRHRPCCADYF